MGIDQEYQQELLLNWHTPLNLKRLRVAQEPTMIKIIRAEPIRQKILRLHFSDKSWGDYDIQPLIDRQTELVLPFNDDLYFQQFFLELGVLWWLNSLELSPGSIHKKLEERQQLHYGTKAA